MYADMIKEKAGPAILEVYPDGLAVYQDDGAAIHRANVSLIAVQQYMRLSTPELTIDNRPPKWQMSGQLRIFGAS